MERENERARVIDCSVVAPSISAIHDGEPIPPEEANHIAGCAECRRRLREYSEIGIELRLLSASTAPSDAGQTNLPIQPARQARWAMNWSRFLSGGTVVPRAIAAATALVILALGVGFAAFVVRANAEGPWVQLSFKAVPNRINGASGMTGIVQSTRTPRGAWVIQASSDAAVAFTARTLEVREASVRVEISVKGFPAAVDVETAKELVKRVPPREYALTSGQILQIPVEGIGVLAVSGRISESRDALLIWNSPPVREGELRLDRPVVLRGREVILDGAGGTISATNGGRGGLTYYVPGAGLLQFMLEPFEGAVEGLVDGSMLQFQESGAEYRIFSRQAIAGGEQPRRVWIRHNATYRPSSEGGDDTEPFLYSGKIEDVK